MVDLGIANPERFSREQRTEAYEQAVMLLRAKLPPDEARQELVDNGIPPELASAAVARVVDARRKSWNAVGKALVYGGAAFLVGGGAITAVSYASTGPGGGYVILTGALASGAAALLVGIGMLARPPSY